MRFSPAASARLRHRSRRFGDSLDCADHRRRPQSRHSRSRPWSRAGRPIGEPPPHGRPETTGPFARAIESLHPAHLSRPRRSAPARCLDPAGRARRSRQKARRASRIPAAMLRDRAAGRRNASHHRPLDDRRLDTPCQIGRVDVFGQDMCNQGLRHRPLRVGPAQAVIADRPGPFQHRGAGAAAHPIRAEDGGETGGRIDTETEAA